MSIWAKLNDIPRWIIYTVLVAVTVAPVLKPISLSVEISEPHQRIFDMVESFAPGDTVLMSVEYSAGVMGDQHPPFVAMTKHLIQKDAKAIFIALGAEGAVFAEKLVDIYTESGKEYGIDVVNLGFVPGAEAAVTAMAESFDSAVSTDYRGNPITELSLINETPSINSVKAVIVNTSGGIGPGAWVRQIYVPYKKPIAMLVAQVMMPATMPYYQAGQFVGVGSGFRFAAEYETLLDDPGSGMAGMAAETLSHFYFMLLVVLGNIGGIMFKRETQGGKQ
jgi:hypothetical protein